MSLECKLGTGRICSRISILRRNVPTDGLLLTPAELGARKGKENVAVKDVAFVNAITLLQRFK